MRGRGCAKEVTTSFPKEVTVRDDVVKGEAGAAMGACSGIAGRRSEVIRIIGVKGMAGDQLEACGLEVV